MLQLFKLMAIESLNRNPRRLVRRFEFTLPDSLRVSPEHYGVGNSGDRLIPISNFPMSSTQDDILLPGARTPFQWGQSRMELHWKIALDGVRGNLPAGNPMAAGMAAMAGG